MTCLQLETDDALLIPKSRAALARYGHQLVIGNDLHKRKFQVVFVERKGNHHGRTNLTPKKGAGKDRLRGIETPPLVDDDLDGATSGDEFVETWLRLEDLRDQAKGGPDGQVEIEELIVQQLVDRHQRWLDATRT